MEPDLNPSGSKTTPDSTRAFLSQQRPRISDHELLKIIGRGSYGEVWLARNIMGSYRAIKIVYHDAFENKRPYEREFEGIQKFEPISRCHESQLDILHVGRDEGYFYYVMELADDVSSTAPGGAGPRAGFDIQSYRPKTLKTLLDQGALPVAECIEIGLALTTALAHLHKNGLVHRDIKPSNIIYVNGLPKLADIGLVSSFDATLSHVGTIGFVPPEGPGTPGADIYSLGKVLYEAATARDRQEFPELPTRLGGTEEEQTAFLELNEVLLKACEGNPRDRYASADEIHEDLLLLRSGKSLVRLRTAEKRLLLARRFGTIAVLLALLGTLGYFYQARQTRLVRKLAEEKTTLLQEKNNLLEGRRQRLIDLNLANGQQRIERGELSSALLWFAEALPLVTNRPSEEHEHRIRIQQTLNQHPRLLQVLPHDGSVFCGTFSPDDKRIATLSKAGLRIWDSLSGALLLGPIFQTNGAASVSFISGGKELFIRSCHDQGYAEYFPAHGGASILSAETGLTRFAITNIGRSALSSDERWLAVARTNNVIEVLDAQTGQVVSQLSGHTKQVLALAFDPKSKLLASGAADGTMRLWRVPSGQAVGSPVAQKTMAARRIHDDFGVCRLVFSPDGRRLLAVTWPIGLLSPSSVTAWDTSSMKEIGQPLIWYDLVTGLFFNKRFGDRFFMNGPEGVELFELHSMKSCLPPKSIDTEVRSWAWSPDGLHLAIGNDQGWAQVWDSELGGALTPKLVHTGYVESVEFNHDGTVLLTTSDDGTAKLWDLTSQPDSAPPLRLPSESANTDDSLIYRTAHAFNPSDAHLIIGGNELQQIDTRKLFLEAEVRPNAEEDPPFTVILDQKGDQWAAAQGFGIRTGKVHNVTLWQRKDGSLKETKLPHPSPARCIQFTEDGSKLITFALDGVIRCWRTSDAKLDLEKAVEPAGMLRCTPDGKRAFIWEWAGPVWLASITNGDPPRVIVPETSGTISLAVSRDSARLATAGRDQHAHIWDVQTGRELLPPLRHGGTVTWVEWNPQETLILTAGLSPQVSVWDSRTGVLQYPLRLSENATAGIQMAHFSPDGRWIFTRHNNRLVQAWSVKTGKALGPPIADQGDILSVLPCGSDRFLTISAPGIIRAFDLRESSLDAQFLQQYAQLLAVYAPSASRPRPPHTASELAELFRRLKRREPQLFEQNPTNAAAFHRSQVVDPFTLLELESSAFHLGRLRRCKGRDPSLDALEQSIRKAMIPPRNPKSSPSLIDLSEFYNSSLGMSWHQDLIGHDLAELPRGCQELDGISFDLRGLIQVAPQQEARVRSQFFFPSRVSGIPVGLKAKRLHFLHATEGEHAVDRGDVGNYLIHYEDGTQAEIPLTYGEQLRDWFTHPEEPEQASSAAVAWRGSNRTARDSGLSVHLYHFTWTNPEPNKEIAALDLVAGTSPASPFLVAVTAE
jgi:WD40 repeat protein/serine/threonine protein kinase